MMLAKNLLFLVATVFIIGCETDNKEQLQNLFPPSTTLVLELKEDIGITSYYVYQISEKLSIESLVNYPIVNEQTKEKLIWHKPTKSEIKDFKQFVSEEQSHEIAIQISKRISNGNYLLALVFNKGRGHFGSKDYLVSDWQDIYLLDTTKNKLIFIQYGKF